MYGVAQLWKLHYLRAEQAEVEEVELIARSISEETFRRQDLADTKVEMQGGPHDKVELKADLDLLDLTIVPDDHDTVCYQLLPMHKIAGKVFSRHDLTQNASPGGLCCRHQEFCDISPSDQARPESQ